MTGWEQRGTTAEAALRLPRAALESMSARRRRIAAAVAERWLQVLEQLGSRPWARRLALAAAGITAVLLLGGFVAGGWALFRIAPAVGELHESGAVPSRLYSRPLLVDENRRVAAADLAAYLSDLGYRELATPIGPPDPNRRELPRGWFEREGSEGGRELIRFRARAALHPLGPEAGSAVEVEIADDQIERISIDGAEASSLKLEPVELHRRLDPQLVDVRPLAGSPVPAIVARAVMAAEDDAFENHLGISVAGIARAAWKNARAGEIRQGASTITQQVARNRFLSHERSLRRKATEALMALVLERRHAKEEILSAYADLVYLGVRDGANVVGLGAGAHQYFGKRLDDLTLGEAATLAGMIAAPGRYSPVTAPERARQRRDWVLHRMQDLGWIDDEQLARALSEPVAVAFRQPRSVDARHYARAAERWLSERAGIDDFESAGYRIDGSVDWLDQLRAERVVRERLAALEDRKRPLDEPLEASLLSLDPRDGTVLAYVGGRDFQRSQFDRVTQARRQIGSLFKPVVFAAAFERGAARADTRILDLPVAVSYGEEVWAPDNSDGRYRGTVSAQRALELSLNAATLRLATRTGLRGVREVAHEIGLPAAGGPAMVLGATDASLWQVSAAYSVFAAGGFKRDPRPVLGVFDPQQNEIPIVVTPPRRVLSEAAALELTRALEGVVARGTGHSARRAGLRDRVAGKTGTSNERRDSWFAGFGADRLTTVWIGHDSYAATPFTGASGALPLWTDFMLAVRPTSGFRSAAAALQGVGSRPSRDDLCEHGATASGEASTLAGDADGCEPDLDYDSWRRRYALFAALQRPPIAERQLHREAVLERSQGAASPPAETILASSRDFQLREVVQLDGPFGNVVDRRVQWVAVGTVAR